ncbi:MAG: hypothetical protein DRR16_31240 [Candidatus Parabeggiatoa sp. nov. 3]|nr:MAG: hypothetical protein DRR00_32215 [Gammaproteobacteria bacterium]RKZ54664.1 MAG: hypothetical protein DRQ99_31055 [Gammaproteobacteria bacterium]RKZ75512.1 MAG: hypothetical protein DRR16_31240 [Gammaproteobacteria bacterium]
MLSKRKWVFQSVLCIPIKNQGVKDLDLWPQKVSEPLSLINVNIWVVINNQQDVNKSNQVKYAF